MKTHRGFTLIEMMVAIGIAAVLMSIAIPSFRTAIRNNCMTASVNLLVTAVQFARSEAVKLREEVRLTAGASPGAAVTDNGNEWGGGWYVWSDADHNGVSNGNEVLRVFAPTCEPNMDATPANVQEFIYDPNGFADEAGTVDVCMDNTGERGRRLSIAITGRPAVDNFTCPTTPE